MFMAQIAGGQQIFCGVSGTDPMKEVIPMEKHILEQYMDMQKEQKDLEQRKVRVQARIRQLEKEQVTDTVSCGKKGKKSLGIKKVQGFPAKEYEKKKIALRYYNMQLELADKKLLTLLNQVEEYIQSIPESRIRRIFRYKHLDGLTWIQVAHRMGPPHTADSCRMAHDRFLKKE